MRMREISLPKYAVAVFSLSLCLCAAAVFSAAVVRGEFAIVVSFLLNCSFFLCMLLFSLCRHPYGLCTLFWLFSFFFFGTAPLLQYLLDRFVWNLAPTADEIFTNNLLILLWSVLFLLGSNGSIYLGIADKERQEPKRRMAGGARAFLALCDVMIVLYLLTRVGFFNILLRYSNRNAQIESTALDLLLTHGFRNILYHSAAVAVVHCKRARRMDLLDGIALLCFLIGCFPTGMPRFMLAAFYGGLMTLAAKDTKAERWYMPVLILGLALLFPLLGRLRGLQGLEEGAIGSAWLDSLRVSYVSGDFDAYQMFISVRRYVLEKGIVCGRQMLGVLLFFVPRSIWPQKPIGTGATVLMELEQFGFTNVSAPLVSEAYMNFGLPGLVLGGFLLGLLCRSIDRKYWKSRHDTDRIRMLYPSAALYFFFLLRGDLLSSWAYTFANVLVGYCVHRLVFRRVSEKETVLSKAKVTTDVRKEGAGWSKTGHRRSG